MKNQTDIPALFTVVAVFFSSVLLKCQTPAAAFKSEEYLLMGDGMRGGGEPQIAVNPLNPKNIVVTSMANLHRAKLFP